MGSPKVGNNYGDRETVVPNLQRGIYAFFTERGRVSGKLVRKFSSAAGMSGTVKSDSANKLLKLANYCKEKRNSRVSDPIYRLMYNTRLFEMAYHNLKSKPANMTKGISPTTLDGMSVEVLEDIISKLRDGTFKFTPGRRVQIPKSNKLRPLTIAPPRDKLVQEVMRMILEAIFEPTFSDESHGFRPGRSCHTALKSIKQKFGVAT